jgi:murein L,D-transpeptidase YafK
MRHLITITALGVVLLLLAAPYTVCSTRRPSDATRQALDQQHLLNTIFEVAMVNEPVHMILVNKTSQQLQVLKHNGSLKVVAQFPCATGENPGTKVTSGDACTPEGVYFITKIFKDKKISVFGNRAFHLDYPNIFDSLNGRNGDGIYLHGTNKQLVPNSTNGCITMKNEDLDQLVRYLDKEETPIVIVQDLNRFGSKSAIGLTADDFKLARTLLLPPEIDPDHIQYDSLYLINYGNQAVVVGDFVYQQHENARRRGYSRAYLEFNPAQGWLSRKRLWYITQSVIFPDNPVKLLAYKPMMEQVDIPPQTTTAVALAQDELRAAEPVTPAARSAPPVPPPSVDHAPKAARQQPGSVNQETKPQPPVVVPAAAETKSAAPAAILQAAAGEPSVMKQTPAGSEPPEQTILKFVEAWRQAWQAKEIDAYIESYAPSFRQGDKDLAGWRRYKENLNRRYNSITVAISDIKINRTPTGATVSFHQVYQSDKFSAEGRKTLLLIHRDEGWAIHRELWARGRT